MPVLPIVPSSERDILEPLSNEQARSAYLERQMQGMSSVKLPLDMPSLEATSRGSENLPRRIQTFVMNGRRKESTSGNLLR